MERDLGTDQLESYVCAHLWPWVQALLVAGHAPTLARFDIKTHILTLEYARSAQAAWVALTQPARAAGLECRDDSAICRHCWQSLCIID